MPAAGGLFAGLTLPGGRRPAAGDLGVGPTTPRTVAETGNTHLILKEEMNELWGVDLPLGRVTGAGNGSQ